MAQRYSASIRRLEGWGPWRYEPIRAAPGEITRSLMTYFRADQSRIPGDPPWSLLTEIKVRPAASAVLRFCSIVTRRESAGRGGCCDMTDRDDFLAWVKTTLYEADLCQ